MGGQSVAGTDDYVWINDDNGNVGIGVSGTSYKLDVQGSILVDPSTGSDTAGTSAGIKFNAQDDSGVGWNLRLGDTSDDGDFNIDRLYSSTWYKSASIDRSTGDFIWYDDDGSTEKMRWDASTDRLGIGTNSPTFPLHVYTADNAPAMFESSDSISEIRLKDNAKYTRLLHVSSQYKIMPNDGVELAIFDGDANTVTIDGTLSATAKSFNIEHPLYKDKRLVHGSLEGPEHGIYLRGTIEATNDCVIELPDYWEAMCDDYTVQLTPHGPYTVFIKGKYTDAVMIGCSEKDYKFDYYIVGSREEIEVVQDG